MSDQARIHPYPTITFTMSDGKEAIFEPVEIIPHRRGFLIEDNDYPLPHDLHPHEPIEIVSVDGHDVVVVNRNGYEGKVRSRNVDVGLHFILPGQAPLREIDTRVWDWLEVRLSDPKLKLREKELLEDLKRRCDVAADHQKWMYRLDV